MQLSVIVRTHDRSNLHGDRYTGTGKGEVTYRCLYSLVQTINSALEAPDLAGILEGVSLTVLDDHSQELELIQRILGEAQCKTQLETLEERGNNASMFRYFMLGAAAPALVYLVEDDYLHERDALREMVRDYITFTKYRGSPVALNPFNDPDNYQSHTLSPSYIVWGDKRHWRTGEWSLCTFMIHSQVIRDHWAFFEEMARFYEKKQGVHEGSTLGRLWSGPVTLFSPIPSVALHVQAERQKDPYIDWTSWWHAADYRHLLPRS